MDRLIAVGLMGVRMVATALGFERVLMGERLLGLDDD